MREFVSLEAVARALDESGQFRVLRRLPKPFFQVVDPPGLKHGIFLDTETTGLDSATCKVIEIALLDFSYDDSGMISSFGRGYTALQDPGEPLSEEVKRVTGLDNGMLDMEAIDWLLVGQWLLQADIVVAHHAAFDRPIVERHLTPAFPAPAELNALLKKPWACSMSEIPWKENGFPNATLGGIATHLSYFFTAHRAMADVEALGVLMSLVPGGWIGDKSLFAQLLESARRTSYRVYANGSPFAVKDTLKARGYKWDDKNKAWFFDIRDNAHAEDEIAPLDKEMHWLSTEGKSRPKFEELTARERYK